MSNRIVLSKIVNEVYILPPKPKKAVKMLSIVGDDSQELFLDIVRNEMAFN